MRLFHSRIPNSVDINSDSPQAMKQVLPATAALLPSTTAFKVIAYGCTSAATVIGEQAVTDAVQSVFPKVASHSLMQALEVLAADDNVDAIVASCTNLRMFGLLPEATARLDMPVISSNSALAWHIQALLSDDN